MNVLVRKGYVMTYYLPKKERVKWCLLPKVWRLTGVDKMTLQQQVSHSLDNSALMLKEQTMGSLSALPFLIVLKYLDTLLV